MLTPSTLHRKVFRARDAIAAGLVTSENLRSQAWRRLFRGVYAGASLTITHEILCAAAITFVAPPGATVAGRSAATLYGARIGTEAVELLVPPGAPVSRLAGLTVHRGAIAPDDRLRRERIPVTTPARTCWDLAQWLEPVEAVVWIDALLALGRVTIDDLCVHLERCRAEAVRGFRRFEKALSLVDGRAESPQESRLRARLALGGLRPPAVQYEIYDDAGRFVARVDLAWPELKVAVEYDGLWHVGSAAQMHADRRRLSGLASQGWTVLHVTSARLRDDLAGVMSELRAALRRRPSK